MTYGLGRAAISSYEDTNGELAGMFIWYGRRSPRGLCDLPRAWSLKVGGGAKSIEPIKAKESSLSLDGVGSVLRAAGGGIGFFGLPYGRPEADDPGRPPHMPADAEEPGRGPNLLDVAEPGRGGPRLPGMLIPPMEPWFWRGPGPRGPGMGLLEPDGGGVMARRATGWAYGITNELLSGS